MSIRIVSSAVLWVALLVHGGVAHPQPARPAAGSGPAWNELSPAQRQALHPLERNWSAADAETKRRWLGVASHFERMSPEEQGRVQQRMNDWVKLSPRERNEARMNFSGARELSPGERRQRWEAYQALPEDQRRKLTGTASPAVTSTDRRTARDTAKSNTVPNPLLQAPRPGATTTPITARPAPPLHQQTGLPKVAATPEFVDPRTLLPKRGAQAAGTHREDKPPAARP